MHTLVGKLRLDQSICLGMQYSPELVTEGIKVHSFWLELQDGNVENLVIIDVLWRCGCSSKRNVKNWDWKQGVLKLDCGQWNSSPKKHLGAIISTEPLWNHRIAPRLEKRNLSWQHTQQKAMGPWDGGWAALPGENCVLAGLNIPLTVLITLFHCLLLV